METEESNRVAKPYNFLVPPNARGTPLQYDSLYDTRRLSNYPTAAGGAAMAFSEEVQRIFSENNLDSMKKSDENLQSKSLATTCMGPDANNNFPSTKMQQRNVIFGNGEDAQKVTSMENCDAAHVNRSFVPHHFAANPTELNLNLGIGLNASGTNPQLTKLDFLSTKKQQCNMTLGNGEDAQKVTSIENCDAVRGNRNFASQHYPTELNLSFGTGFNASDTNPQLTILEDDDKIKRDKKKQSNRESARRTRMRKQQECEERSEHLATLKVKNSSLKKKLIHLSDKCGELMDENNSIQEELIEKYGPESIVKLMLVEAGTNS